MGVVDESIQYRIYYLSENSTYEEFLQTAVEILSYEMSVHGVELGRTKRPIKALKSISEMAKSAANITEFCKIVVHITTLLFLQFD
jgi:hypothetical protein